MHSQVRECCSSRVPSPCSRDLEAESLAALHHFTLPGDVVPMQHQVPAAEPFLEGAMTFLLQGAGAGVKISSHRLKRGLVQDLEGRLQTAQHTAYLAETKAQAASDALTTVRQRSCAHVSNHAAFASGLARAEADKADKAAGAGLGSFVKGTDAPYLTVLKEEQKRAYNRLDSPTPHASTGRAADEADKPAGAGQGSCVRPILTAAGTPSSCKLFVPKIAPCSNEAAGAGLGSCARRQGVRPPCRTCWGLGA